MNKMQQQVREFHETFGVPCPEVPTMPDTATQSLREKLIWEEFEEFQNANLYDDLVAATDAIADMAYVVFGAALAYGIDLEPIFDEVHHANLGKAWTHEEMMAHNNESEPLTFISAGNGRYIAKRADGKVKKPASHSHPNIGRVLSEQMEAKCNGKSD